ncbi:MAG: hypothetical protein US51_C0005G0009 [Microgenomates group bacterium GW2011_GWA2_37_6]|nr:MAG: hypothetical protein US51_C0005G0009 [Microgenomates group bacterium GW2011_GWA2_37_6]
MNPAAIAPNRRKFFLIGIVILFVVVPIVLFALKGKLSIPNQSLFKKSSVELKTTYANPFKKDTQYVNPFQKYKNPFIVNR